MLAGLASRSLRAVKELIFAYFCVFELLPLPVLKAASQHFLHDWATQQVVLIAVLSCLAAVASVPQLDRAVRCRVTASALFAAINTCPIAAAVITSRWSLLSDNCPMEPDGCDSLASVLDIVGLVCARVARLDLGLCLLLSARGDSAWVTNASNGYLGYSEAIPLHRVAGWYCAGQSALHSVAYLLFYLETGGASSLWRNCLPVALPDGRLNRLGIVNGFGVVALLVLIILALPAVPRVRRLYYHIFQRMHAPLAALFVLCCALHDLPILLYALPGLSCWYLGWRTSRPRKCIATARVLPQTNWIEILVEPHGTLLDRLATSGIDILVPGSQPLIASSAAPRGSWVSVQVLPLGAESHPLSLTLGASCGSTTCWCMVVSAQSGDWSQKLAVLARSKPTSSVEITVTRPIAFGGGPWSLEAHASGAGQAPSLLLLAGGTGVTGWLPALSRRSAGTGRRCHLVWCVQKEADYRALAARLPELRQAEVTIFVTRRSESCGAVATAVACRVEHANGAGGAVRLRPLSCSSSGSVSLAATLVSLVVGYLGWPYFVELAHLPRIPDSPGWVHETLVGYTVTRRCMPILLIVMSIVLTTAAVTRALARTRTLVRMESKRRCCPVGTELGVVRAEIPQVPLLSPAQQGAALEHGVTDAEAGADAWGHDAGAGGRAEIPQAPLLSPAQQGAALEHGVTDAEAGAVTLGHKMRSGRPDLVALVRAAVAGRETEAQSVVVMACGPETLVESARKAVAVVRKERHGACLEFSGGASAW